MRNGQVSLLHEEKESLSLQFGGDNNIDANLLASSIENIVQIIEYARDEATPDTPIRLTVKAVRPGSFIIDFEGAIETLSNLNGALGLVITLSIGVIKLVKWLKGRAPKEAIKSTAETVELENADGEKKTVELAVYNLLTNKNCTDRITDMFVDLSEDGTRTYLKLSSVNDQVFIENQEYEALAKEISLENLDEIDAIRIPEAELIINKPVLSGHAKWSFYLDKQFNASIEDESFLENVRQRKYAFGNGDSLIVSLRIERRKDRNGQIVMGSERYFVEKVLRVKPLETIDENQITIDEYLENKS